MTRCCPQREGPIAFWSSSGICVSLLPRRRRQPSGGSARAEPVFPTRGRWPPRECRRHVMVVGALVPPDAARVATSVATVYTNAPKRLREAVFADLCTLLRSHDRSRDRVGSWVPRHRRPYGSCDARALGSEVHAARAVTRPPTHTNSRSLPFGRLIDTGKRVSERVVRDVWNVVMMLYLSYAHGHQEPFEL